MFKKSSTTSKIAIGALFAAVVGFLAGILTAPKSGKETREDIKEGTAKVVANTEKELKVLHTEISDLIANAKTKGADFTGKAKAELDDLTAKAEVSRQKAREVISGFHEGDSDDKDLGRAIKESKQAIEHLKTYLKK